MADTVSLCFMTFIVLIKFIACQFPMTYRDHYCLGPENETATAAYQSSLVSLLDSMSFELRTTPSTAIALMESTVSSSAEVIFIRIVFASFVWATPLDYSGKVALPINEP
ncbi:hypothetical protein V6N13_078745 [Hibiscus sabdariffa]|uniref:Secreted protein n=1 Tax=Hibiscus sabdariffa TaxID=183260 RepID=A0ABR2RPQ0_9ROSI